MAPRPVCPGSGPVPPGGALIPPGRLPGILVDAPPTTAAITPVTEAPGVAPNNVTLRILDALGSRGGSRATGRCTAHVVPPPPLSQHRPGSWFMGAEVREHGGRGVLDKARGTARHVPRNTRCRHQPPPPTPHPPPQPSTHPTTQQHMALHPHHHSAPPHGPLLRPCTTLHTTFPIGVEPQNRWFKKKTKSAETRGRHVWTSPCQDRGGGGTNSATVRAHDVPAKWTRRKVSTTWNGTCATKRRHTK